MHPLHSFILHVTLKYINCNCDFRKSLLSMQKLSKVLVVHIPLIYKYCGKPTSTSDTAREYNFVDNCTPKVMFPLLFSL